MYGLNDLCTFEQNSKNIDDDINFFIFNYAKAVYIYGNLLSIGGVRRYL